MGRCVPHATLLVSLAAATHRLSVFLAPSHTSITSTSRAACTPVSRETSATTTTLPVSNATPAKQPAMGSVSNATPVVSLALVPLSWNAPAASVLTSWWGLHVC